jgi:hypothetical protein
MGRSEARPQSIVVRTYGRGSLLGLIQPLFAWLMAQAGLHGWEQSARADMERDAQAMLRRGYRVTAVDEYALAPFAITWFRVTYVLDSPAEGGAEGT